MRKKRHLAKGLDRALAVLRQTTGVEGRVLPSGPARGGVCPDGLVEFRVARRTYRFAVHAKRALDRAETLGLLKDRLARHKPPCVLFAPYVTDTVARKCRELDIPFIDGAGNAYLQRPGLYVFVTGQKPPEGAARERPARGLNTETALRMVFGLLCRPELLNATYRDITDATGVALGAVGRVLFDLRKRGFLAGGDRRRDRRLVEPHRLFEEWVTNYPTKLRPKLNARRFGAQDRDWWKTAHVEELAAVWGGEVAADRLTHYVKPTMFTLYVPTETEPKVLPELVRLHRLRADADGDVEVLDKFWNFDVDTAASDLAPPILVYADLVATLEPRNLEAAKAVREKHIDGALDTL